MSSLPPIVSTLAASDVVPVKPAATIGAPNPVVAIEKALNDARLMSRAGAELQLANSLLRRDAGSASGTHITSSHTALSATARAISAILGDASGGMKNFIIKAQHPLLPLAASASWQAASSPGTISKAAAGTFITTSTSTFTAALTRVVANSGLFYESHLLQYVFGRRHLANILLEPQARLGPLAQRFPELFSADLKTREDATAQWLSARAAMSAQLSKAMPQRVFEHAVGAVLPEEPGDDAGPDSMADRLPAQLPEHGPDATQHAAANKLQAAYAASDGANKPAQLQQSVNADNSRHNDDFVAEDFSTSAYRFQQKNGADMSVATVAADLMRHQLEILATSWFRWQGEAWPGAPMEWELRRQADERQDQPNNTGENNDGDSWSSSIKMTLPALGVVELRISLRDNNLQTYVYAKQESSVAAMRSELDDLRQRFAAGDLQLHTLELAVLPAGQP